jgi:hypothetical protein
LTLGSVTGPFTDYLVAAMLPGIPAAIAQLIVLSLVARWWVERKDLATEEDITH